MQTWLFYEGVQGARGALVAVLMASQADARLTAADLARLEAEFASAAPPDQRTRAGFARWLRNARDWRALFWTEYPGP